MSQRLPLNSALHMLLFVPTIELVMVLLVPPTSEELLTLEPLFEMIEPLDPPPDVDEVTELDEFTEFDELMELEELIELDTLLELL